MHVRLGQLLVDRGVMTRAQVDDVLRFQKESGEPFGVLSERMFDVAPEAIEEAWVVQYVELTREIDPRNEVYDEHAMSLVTRRQAWQFRVLPIRFDGDELMIATSAQHLQRALRFATKIIGMPVYFVMSEPLLLGRALCEHYPIAGMTPLSINDDSLDKLLAMARAGAA